jgi:glycosyltransferase involved in cell wall biosynthesis
MKILMVLTSYFPPDSRVEKEAISLSEAGHEVHIICYAEGDKPLLESTDHYIIHRFRASDFVRNKLSAIALLVPFYFHKWRKQINILQKQHFFDAIHIHDLPLSKVGYYFKKKYGCKLICDQHEFYSEWITKTAHMNTLRGKIISSLSNWKKYENKYLLLADLVITVAEPLRLNYLKKYELNEDKIITVPNTPTKKIFNRDNINKEIVEKYKNDFVLFYAGGIDILRGIDTAIKALTLLKDEIPNIKLLLAGRIVKPYDPFKTAKKFNVEKFLEFKGWIDEQDLPSYITASDICFSLPSTDREETNNTIATKIYLYATMKRPIIASNAKTVKKFIEENKLGINIPHGNYVAFAENVLKYKNKQISYQPNSIEKFTWEETVKPLCRGYKDLM